MNRMDKLDVRAVCANNMCKLLVKAYGGIEPAMEHIDKVYYDLFATVRNIYELVSEYIPLFELHEFRLMGSITKVEYLEDIDFEGTTDAYEKFLIEKFNKL